MFELRQLDLQLAFGTGRAQGEDVEDQAVAIDHPALQGLLKVALLNGRQGVIEDDQLGIGGGDHGRHLIDLAFAGKGPGIGTVPSSTDFGNDLATGRFGQQTEFFKLVLDIDLPEIQLHDDGALAGGGALMHGEILREKTPSRRRGTAG